MACHGVYLPEEFSSAFIDGWDLMEERSHELGDVNPMFDSHGKRVLYRIRCVHYTSSRAPKEQLMKTGETWTATFSNFRAECFIDGYAEFNFFVGPCAGGPKWYMENPYRFFLNSNSLWRGPRLLNSSGGASGASTTCVSY